MKYEDIKKANEEISTIDIKGKEYAQVNQRIKAFRMVYPDGCIFTSKTYEEDGRVEFRALVYEFANIEYIAETKQEVVRGKLLATGTAYEKENSTFINKTSHIENAETSAIGRALGMAGFGIDTSVSSAEEVENAINNQNLPKVSAERLTDIKGYILDGYIDEDKILKYYNIKKLEMLDVQQASEVERKAMKVKNEQTK